ncbi:PD-(D/E)XK nuclease family protein [uncultured Fusobacterium sp.]|nr:PD-(D/E)XK nuclease family protein [uncultured Fusobacterium sp.]
MNKYKLFLENINLIDKKYQILKSKDENFNIFSILRNEYDEVNLHSKFIVELIKNKTYGYKFLILFLKKIGIDFFEIKDYQVFGEYTVKNNGRIDILIKIYSKIEKKVIVLENKIYAEDQFQQLKRYYDSMVREGYKDKEIEIVYLTLFGQAPSEESILGLKGKNIIEISYKNEIIEWIEELIKEVAQNPIMRETLVQYKNLLEKLTNSEEKDFMKELKEMILLNQEYLNIAWKLPDIVESIKVDLQLKFWQKLEEKLDVSLKEKGFLKENSLPFPNHHYSKENIEKFYRNMKKNRWFGLMYFIKEIENRGKLYLRIEVEENIYYGFRIIDNLNNFNQNDKDDLLEKEMLKLKFQRTENWLGWKYIYNLENKEQRLNLKNMNNEVASVLNDDKKLDNLILGIEKDILNTLNVLF